MHIGIVGGGVIGLLCAVESVLAGHRVTLLEQDDLPSPFATSSDRHRILRCLHSGDVASTAAAVRAHRRWIELERILSRRFYLRVGSLTALTPDLLPQALSALWNSDVQARVLSAGDLIRDYPHVSFGGNTSAVLEKRAGILLAERVLHACIGWLRWQSRVTLLSRHSVVAIDAGEPAMTCADGQVVRADALILAAGPWSRRLIAASAAQELTLYRQSVVYLQVPARQLTQWARTPAIPALGTQQGAWLVPPVAGTPLKISSASACRHVEEISDHQTPADQLAHLSRLSAHIVAGFEPDWVIDARDCYYLGASGTRLPATLTLSDSVVALAACGGGAFKFAPLIARALLRRVSGPGSSAPERDLASERDAAHDSDQDFLSHRQGPVRGTWVMSDLPEVQL